MAQQIKQANIWGRIGSGIGKGLAEQLPEEIQRGRLSQGLQQLTGTEEGRNLPLISQLGALYSLPGNTPQMIQTFGELARLNQQGTAYRNAAGQAGRPTPNQRQPSPTPNQIPAEGQQSSTPMQEESGTQRPQIVPGGALSEAERTKAPWTPQERNAVVSDYIDQGFLPDQAKQLAADDEARFLAQPGALQQRRAELTGLSKELEDELTKQLSTKLQIAPGEGGFLNFTSALPGTAINSLKREMESWKAENPNATFKDAAHEFSNRGLELARTITQLNTEMQTAGIENIWKGGGNELLNKLKGYEKIFTKAGNGREYKDMLVSGLGLSQQGASSIAFPLSKSVKGYVNDYHPQNKKTTSYGELLDSERIANNSKRAALAIVKRLEPNDSIMSIVSALKAKDPNFDQEAFIGQLLKDSDLLNPRQQLELSKEKIYCLPGVIL